MDYSKKTKISYRLFSILLCVSMLASTFYGCDSDKDNKRESSTVASSGHKTTAKEDTTGESGTTGASSGETSGSGSAGTTKASSGTTSKSTTKSSSKATTKAPTQGSTPAANAPYAAPVILTPTASGTVVYSNALAVIDASNTPDGYIMVKYLGSNGKVKLILQGPSNKYTYDINARGSYEVFPLSDGSGTYTAGVYENISGTSYSMAYSTSFGVSLSSQFAPFLRPNQFVNYSGGTSAVLKAATLSTGCSNDLGKVENIYNFVINNFTYDDNKAATVQSGYLPNLDAIYASRTGICFDYASLMTAMLRSQGIPTKLVIGYAGSAYHAWINTYITDVGWVNGIIYFDGKSWKLMDPTFASTGKQSTSVMNYINNTSNYSAKYYY